MNDELPPKFMELVAAQLGVEVEALSPEARLQDDLGVDSLDVVELLLAIEERFGVELQDEEVEGVVTVADLCACFARAVRR